MSLIFQKIQIMAQPKKLLLELCPSGDPTPETLRAATQIWSAGQGFHFTQWLLFWGSKTCLFNHLGFQGSLLAWESGREMGATKLCNKHILEFTNLPWTLRGKCLTVCSSTHCFKMGLRYKPWICPSQRCPRLCCDLPDLSYIFTTWTMLRWFGFHHLGLEWAKNQ